VSIRLKVILIILAVVSVVTASAMGMSFYFIHDTLTKTIENDISVIAELAEDLVSTEVKLLKARAVAAAQRLALEPEENRLQAMKDLLAADESFTALSLFNADGPVSAYGEAPTPAALKDSVYFKRAFAGETIISTTRQDPSGELVFHICTPVQSMGMVLSVTIPGLLFSDMLAPFKIWETGTVFILDGDGTVLANERRSMVLNRYNAIAAAKTDPKAVSSAEHTRHMIRGGKGVGRYILFDSERLAVYTPVTGSNAGWVLGVSAPFSETPAAHVGNLLLLTALGFLVAGSATAFFVSAQIARPFLIISKQNERLDALRESAKNASEAKSNFLATMSHEMRTPLTAVIGFSELMLFSPAGEEERRANLQKVHTAGMTLLGIVNDILDISKIEAGRLELIPEEYDVASLINNLITVNLISIRDKPVRFELRIDEGLPDRLVGDVLRVKQLCNNLLGNACKYTREGRIELHVSGEREGGDVWLTVAVKDTGIGIAAGDIDRLFDKYMQLDARSNRRIEGTGLGLAIAVNIAKMMDGGITVESEYGKGSTFTARIRQQFVTDAPIGAEIVENLKQFHYIEKKFDLYARRAIIRLPHAKVLVVDDIPANLDVARGMLKPYAVQVDCAGSGLQAITLIREEKVRYNAIFMDHMMPDMDGVEAVRVIREEIGTEYAKNVPVIALTANAVAGNEQMFLRNGFQAFLSKPIDLTRLDLVMKHWIRDKMPAADSEEASQMSAEASEISAEASQISGEAAEMSGEASEMPGERSGGSGTERDLPSAAPEGESAARGAAAGNPRRIAAPDADLAKADLGAGPARRIADLRQAGLDYARCLERFGGDEESALRALRSYFTGTPALLDGIRAPSAQTLRDYTITVHGIKSSSLGICAGPAGKAAEELERAAEAGDLAFIGARNDAFLKTLESLLAALGALLRAVDEEKRKPRKEEPDAAALRRLREACAAYDMDGADKAMAELERFSYERRADEIVWLRERVDEADFTRIAERLAANAQL
jgi:signal transduction histidine kinase/CheY-like chemotaxis protein